MDVHPGDIVIGLMMTVFAILGLFLAAGALDIEMEVFGLSLAGFSMVFIFGQIRRHYDAVDAVPATVPVERRRHG